MENITSDQNSTFEALASVLYKDSPIFDQVSPDDAEFRSALSLVFSIAHQIQKLGPELLEKESLHFVILYANGMSRYSNIYHLLNRLLGIEIPIHIDVWAFSICNCEDALDISEPFFDQNISIGVEEGGIFELEWIIDPVDALFLVDQDLGAMHQDGFVLDTALEDLLETGTAIFGLSKGKSDAAIDQRFLQRYGLDINKSISNPFALPATFEDANDDSDMYIEAEQRGFLDDFKTLWRLSDNITHPIEEPSHNYLGVAHNIESNLNYLFHEKLIVKRFLYDWPIKYSFTQLLRNDGDEIFVFGPFVYSFSKKNVYSVIDGDVFIEDLDLSEYKGKLLEFSQVVDFLIYMQSEVLPNFGEFLEFLDEEQAEIVAAHYMPDATEDEDDEEGFLSSEELRHEITNAVYQVSVKVFERLDKVAEELRFHLLSEGKKQAFRLLERYINEVKVAAADDISEFKTFLILKHGLPSLFNKEAFEEEFNDTFNDFIVSTANNFKEKLVAADYDPEFLDDYVVIKQELIKAADAVGLIQPADIFSVINQFVSEADLEALSTFTDLNGQNFATFAASLNAVEVLHMIHKKGISFDIRDGAQLSCLDLSASKGANDALEYILSNHLADPLINSTDGFGGLTPLHYAATAGNVEGYNLLVEYGADPSIKTPQGETADELFAKHKRH